MACEYLEPWDAMCLLVCRVIILRDARPPLVARRLALRMRWSVFLLSCLKRAGGRLLRLDEFPDDYIPLQARQEIDEEFAVEVVDFMLYHG